MKSYYLPREYKGEGRILVIFSGKSMIYTGVGMAIGLIVNKLIEMTGLFKLLGLSKTLIPVLLIFGAIGYGLATIKLPDGGSFEITKKLGGENLDEIIKRWFMFKLKHGKIYVYDENPYETAKEEEIKDE